MYFTYIIRCKDDSLDIDDGLHDIIVGHLNLDILIFLPFLSNKPYENIPIAAPSANLSGKPSGTSVSNIIDDFKDKFDIEVLPNEEKDHYQTMGGFLTSNFGYIPKVGEKFQWNDFTFRITKLDRARIDQFIMEYTPKQEIEEDEEE